MINEIVSLDRVISLLNDLVGRNPKVVTELFETRVNCGSSFRDHETLQLYPSDTGEYDLLGLLGILNGIFGKHEEGPKKGWGAITAVYKDNNGNIIAFKRTDPNHA